MSNQLISVVMPNLNGERRLERAIESVLVQSYPNFELIVVDGKSTDHSHKILSRLAASDPRVRWINEVDAGLSDAINRGVRHSRGGLIGYLGHDDEYLPSLFSEVAWLADRIDFDGLMFSSYAYFVAEGRCDYIAPAVKEITADNLLRFGTMVGLQNIFYRSRVFDTHRFDPENKYSMDYQLLWDLVLDGANRLFVFSDSVASVNYFEGNISHNNCAQAREAMAIAQARIGDYAGPVWFESMLPSPPEVSAKITLKQRIQRRLRFWLGIESNGGALS